MSKVIIGIHGLGNKPPKKVLEDWWMKAMKEGIVKIKNTCELPKFEMVYWADILYEKPLNESLLDKKDPSYLAERYSPGVSEYIPQKHTVRQKILDIIESQLDKLFLNGDLSVNYSGLTDVFLRTYFKDLEVYYAKECEDENDIRCKARDLIRNRLLAVLKKYRYDEIFLISHSMGSIVAYDVLTFLAPEIEIHSFVTMGSPLGFPVVQGKIAAEWQTKRLVPPKLATPPGIKKHWYNFADLKDKVALVYDLSDNFQPNASGVEAEDFIVANDFRTESNFNPHKSFGYLRTSEFAQVLAHFCMEKISFKHRLKNFILKVLRPFSGL